MKKFKRKWLVFMLLTMVLCLAGAVMPDDAETWMPDAAVDRADVAWMITATIFVLMMTPGLSFFYGGMVGKKNVISTILQSFIAMGVVSVVGGKNTFATTAGMLCGAMANPIALNYVNETLPGDKASVAYATVYPLCMFLRVIIAQLIVMFWFS